MPPTGPLRRGVYAITPEHWTVEALCALLPSLLEAGLAAVQVRNKSMSSAHSANMIDALLPLCRRHGTPLIVNDDLAMALHRGADGVHLGGSDGDLAAARRRLARPGLLGASCYADLALAAAARDAGADYLAFGAMYPSASKHTPHRAEPAHLRAARPWGVPLVAIGGITVDNAAPLIAAGAHCLAVIGGLWQQPDPLAALRTFNRLYAQTPVEPSNDDQP